MSPPSVVAGSAAFSLTVTGAGFVGGDTATVGGQTRTVTVGAPHAGDHRRASPGQVAVQVSNPALCTSSGTSAAIALSVSNLAPALSSLAPSGALHGGPAFSPTVTGSGFVPASTVQWNGGSRTTTFVSATQLTASIPANDLVAAGTAQVTVVTPAPGGGTSGTTMFNINNPVPTPGGRP